MEKFQEVLKKYSSEDNYRGTDKSTKHSYGPIYEKILQEMAERPDLTILEIGILSGAFLQVLHEVLPNAKIHGLDITLKNYRFDKKKNNIILHEADATRKETARSINEKFDLIIDDGSHFPEHQKKTLDAFAPYLKENGVFVIEDIPYGSGILKRELETIGKTHRLHMEWIDLTNIKKRFDDILAIFTKPPSS